MPSDSEAIPNALKRLKETRRQSVIEQSKSYNPAALGDNATIKDLPKIVLAKRRFVREDWVVTKSKKGRRSWIRQHGAFLVELNSLDKEIDHVWCCQYCDTRPDPVIYNAASTDNAARHLGTKHDIYDPSDTDDVSSGPSRKRARTGAISVLEMVKRTSGKQIIVVNEETKLKEEICAWIVDANVPMWCVRHQTFQKMLLRLNPGLVQAVVPQSDTTIKRWLVDMYKQHKANIMSSLENSLSKIHISFDLWTAPNALPLIGVVGHWLDQEVVYQTRLLAMELVQGSHTGENQAPYLLKVINDFNLNDKLGFMTADNATSCDHAVQALYHLLPTQELLEDEFSGVFRIRCFGHILNLIAKAFLEGGIKRKLPQGDTIIYREVNAEELAQWRKMGPVGKLHNIVTWIRGSPQRRQAFFEVQSDQELRFFVEDSQPPLQTVRDNDTRWNSTLSMVERALRLKPAIDLFSARTQEERDLKKRLLKEDILTTEDWRVLTEIRDILQPFKELTLYFEGCQPRFTYTLPFLCWLRFYLEDRRRQYADSPPEAYVDAIDGVDNEDDANEDDEGYQTQRGRRSRLPKRLQDSQVELHLSQYHKIEPILALPGLTVERSNGSNLAFKSSALMRTNLDYCIEKVEKYQALLEESPVYWAAHILHPGYRSRWLQRNLPDRRYAIIGSFRDLYERFYKPRPSSRTGPGESSRPEGFTSHLTPAGFYDIPADEPVDDEIDRYLGEHLRPVDDVFAWWRVNKDRFPTLFTMAMDLLSIPPMSTHCERSFSRAGLTISSQRHSLEADTINVYQCLGSWLPTGGS